LIHLPPTFIPSSRFSTASRTSSSIGAVHKVRHAIVVMKTGIPVSHLCPPSPVPSTLSESESLPSPLPPVTNCHTFSDPSILTRICCPMYRFPISLLSLQSIPIRLIALTMNYNYTHNDNSLALRQDGLTLLILLFYFIPF